MSDLREKIAREVRLAMLDNPTDHQGWSFRERSEFRTKRSNEAADVILSALREVEGRNEALSRSLDQAREGLENPCLQMRRPDEPFFVLLGRDAQAISAVWHWIAKREEVEGYSEKTKAARKVALAMEAYLSSLEGNQKQTKTGRLPPAEGRAGGADAPQPASQSSPFGRSSLTQEMDIVEHLRGPHEWGYRDPVEGMFIEDNAPFDAATEIERLRQERDKAQAAVYRLEQRIAGLEDEVRARHRWLDRAKEERGYHRNVSFDTVWAEICALADQALASCDGSPTGRDAKQLDGEATTARSDAVGDAHPFRDGMVWSDISKSYVLKSLAALRSPEEE